MHSRMLPAPSTVETAAITVLRMGAGSIATSDAAVCRAVSVARHDGASQPRKKPRIFECERASYGAIRAQICMRYDYDRELAWRE